MTNTERTPSPGALRAAKAIEQELGFDYRDDYMTCAITVNTDAIAAIIDAETDAAELADALEAIEARIRGVWDHPALIAFGPLSVDTGQDCLDIARNALARYRGMDKEGDQCRA